jgi:hypothetical protein
MRYTTQQSAWMDEESMLEWIEVVWQPFTRQRKGLCLLILDEARSHLTDKVQRRFSELNTLLEIIPGGYTAKLQVLDVGINRPFKKYYEEASEEFVRRWVMKNAAGVKPKPSRVDVSHWIQDSWSRIKRESIMNTWRRIGYIKQSEVDFYLADSSDGDY